MRSSVVPTPTPHVIEGEGVIRSVSRGSVTIGNKKVQITEDTVVDEQLQSGDRVKVSGDLQSDGSFIATKIESDNRRVQLEGTLESMSPAIWTVDGQRVRLTADTRISGEASEGSKVKVVGTRQSNGTVLALKIAITVHDRALEESGGQEPPDTRGDGDHSMEDGDKTSTTQSLSPTAVPRATHVTDITATPEPHPVKLEGLIQGIQDNRLRVAGRTVVITNRTIVEGTPTLGLQVRIEGVEQSNGTIQATRVVVVTTEDEGKHEDSGNAPTPDLVPALVPTPTVTPEHGTFTDPQTSATPESKTDETESTDVDVNKEVVI